MRSVMSVPEVVREVITRNRSIYDCMKMDLINYTALAVKIQPEIEKIVGKKLLPTYSFWRMYTYGGYLKKHTDREACEISVTLNIMGDTDWPIYIEDNKVYLKPGDGVVYLGCELNHEREKLKGDYQAQIFLHYVVINFTSMY